MGNGSGGGHSRNNSNVTTDGIPSPHHGQTGGGHHVRNQSKSENACWPLIDDGTLCQLPLVSADYLMGHLEHFVPSISMMPQALLSIIAEYARHVHQIAAIFTLRRPVPTLGLTRIISPSSPPSSASSSGPSASGIYIFPALTPDPSLTTSDGFDAPTPSFSSSMAAMPRTPPSMYRVNDIYQLVIPILFRKDGTLIITDMRSPDGDIINYRYDIGLDIWCDHHERSIPTITSDRLAGISLCSGRLVYGDMLQSHHTTRTTLPTWLHSDGDAKLLSTPTNEWYLPSTKQLANKRSLMIKYHVQVKYLIHQQVSGHH
jgi:hypothetical protein